LRSTPARWVYIADLLDVQCLSQGVAVHGVACGLLFQAERPAIHATEIATEGGAAGIFDKGGPSFSIAGNSDLGVVIVPLVGLLHSAWANWKGRRWRHDGDRTSDNDGLVVVNAASMVHGNLTKPPPHPTTKISTQQHY
jgi:hypothetical protein